MFQVLCRRYFFSTCCGGGPCSGYFLYFMAENVCICGRNVEKKRNYLRGALNVWIQYIQLRYNQLKEPILM